MSFFIERKMDILGRIVLPIEIRKKCNITERSLIQIYDDNGKIVLEKAEPSCKLCGSCDNINEGLRLCLDCIEKIKSY